MNLEARAKDYGLLTTDFVGGDPCQLLQENRGRARRWSRRAARAVFREEGRVKALF